MHHKIVPLVPGLCLSAAVTGAAVVLEQAETALFGRAWLESLVLAIVLGSVVRTAMPVPAAMAVRRPWSAASPMAPIV